MRIATKACWGLGLYAVLTCGCERVREAQSNSERVRVAGMASELAGASSAQAWHVPGAAQAASAEEHSGAASAGAPGVRSSAELSLGEIAAYAQRWTAAVRADRNYGAAVILDRAGLLLTNQHVVDSARSITVTPFGGETHGATVLDADAQLDLALLGSADALPDAAAGSAEGSGAAGSARRVALGDASSLAAGDQVLAVGSPLQMYFSVSHGVVSYVHRTFDGVDFVQTDAPINAGNSGGPLFDRHARVVGVISFILRDSQRLSFALPIERAVARFAAQLAAWQQRPSPQAPLARASSPP